MIVDFLQGWPLVPLQFKREREREWYGNVKVSSYLGNVIDTSSMIITIIIIITY